MAKLPNAPLQEAVFELRWTLDVNAANKQEVDTGYDLAQGKLQAQAHERFPVHIRKSSSLLLPLMYKIAHQFWRDDNQTFPVLQLGPGVFTVNDTDKNYDWEKEFFPLIETSLDWLYNAYDGQLQPNFLNLRYIDSVDLGKYDFDGDWLRFVKDNLKVDLTNHFEHPGNLGHLSINQSFVLDEQSELNISIHSGVDHKTGSQLLIWQTGVVVVGEIEKADILQHVQKAHQHTSLLFKKMTKGPFYGSFS
jgi:uncharacterized protein (TIGR04255 family)